MKKHQIKVLAIDPGLTNTGWVMMEHDLDSRITVLTKFGSFHPGPAAEKAEHKEELEKFSKRTISLKLLWENLRSILLAEQPDYIAVEDIFFNPQRPTAHAALAMYHGITRMVCMDVLRKPIEIIQTKIAKQEMTGSGGNGKLSVQQGILTHKDIKFKNKQVESQMDEHCADAVAVGYAFIVRNRERFLIDLGEIKEV